ncbi:hypothetical protein FEP69_06224 [Burkholderia multivorans]|nr:hypothetical protein [Burkholderia multivorans]
MARVSEQLSGERGPLLIERRLGIETGFGETLQQIRARVEPVVTFGDPIDDRWIHTERFAGLAQCAARSVRGNGRGQRRAIAAVLAVDVLHHLFATLMLEVDVDVRRLVALLAHEPLEQHRLTGGIDLRHAEAVADGGVCRRPAALAQDAVLTRELHDVVDGKEIRLVVQFRDQLQLVFDLRLHVDRNAGRKAPLRTDIRLFAQVGRDVVAGWNHLVRVFVLQVVE